MSAADGSPTWLTCRYAVPLRGSPRSALPIGTGSGVLIFEFLVLNLLLVPSGALNVAFTAGLTARLAGAGPAPAIPAAAGAAGTVMAIFFAAASAYR